MGPLDLEGGEERRGVIGELPRRIAAGGLVALAGTPGIDGNAGEVLGIFADLEGVAGVVGRQIGDEQQGFAGALLLVVDGYVVDLDLGHGASSRLSVMTASARQPERGLPPSELFRPLAYHSLARSPEAEVSIPNRN